MAKSQLPSLKPHIGRLSFVAFVICLVACARPDDAWDRVRETGILRVGMDASFPPFEFISADGELAGFEARWTGL